MKSSSPLTLPAWQTLASQGAQPAHHLRDLFAQDAARPARMTVEGAGITLGFSRQRITPEILQSLLALAEQADVAGQREAMFSGAPINATERRSALHVALRGAPNGDAP